MLFRPFESSKNIVDFYRRYLLTTFSTNRDIYNKQLKELLKADKTIADGPYISMSDPYDKGMSLSELANKNIVSKEILKIKNFYPERKLYRHQEEAVRKATEGKNLIITTGTGSGKTESFLIPVINQLLREKENGTLGPGVRALIIYPMNALVNDQIRRLRELLSKMEDEPKITFGRFTGETEETYKDAYKKYAEIENVDTFCLNNNELICRKQMRETPPNILITNYAMLEYMLLRPGDNIIFSEKNSLNWQYIVFDEAHSYNGAKGIEVASLVKRLKAMLKRNDIKFILTSATLGDENSNDEIIRFGKSLCDVEFTESSIVRSYIKQIKPIHDVIDLDYNIYRKIAESIRKNKSDDLVKIDLKQLGIEANYENNLSEILFDIILHDNFYYRARKALNGKIKTVDAVAKELKISAADFTDFIAVASNAMRDNERLFEAKYHMFLRGMEGVFVTLNPSNKVFINRMEAYKENFFDDDIGYKVYEISFCHNCNALFIAGQEENGHLIQRSKFNDDYSPNVFMVSKDFDGDEENYEENVFQLCAKCGAIKRASSVDGLQCGHGKKNINLLVRVKKSGEDLHKCPYCHSRNGHRSILRPYFLGNEAATAVISTALYNELPGEIHHVERKIISDPFFGEQVNETDNIEIIEKQFLTFSDNRQNAAFFATYLDSTYRDSLVKRIMYQIVEENKEDFIKGLSLKDFADLLIGKFETEKLFPECSEGECKKKAWIYIIKEVSNYKAKNSLLSKGILYFEIDFDAPAPTNQLDLSKAEMNDLFNMLARHMMRDASIEIDNIHFNNEEEKEIVPSGIIKGYDETATGCSYIGGWSCEEGKTNKRIKYLTRIFDGDEPSARKLLSSIWGYMTRKNFLKYVKMRSKRAYKLDAKKIKVKTVSKLYCCTECKNITPYNIKDTCENPHCNGKLIPYDFTNELKDDHYHKLYTELDIVPMCVQEHTAQLSNDKAYEYQRQFKDKKINVLSCSTTFEMGVDVGSLETVFMRNMPPSPANYAQRAGRAGRSLKSAAYAITFCPNNSHDLNYFKNPAEMIQGSINPPYFNISNEKIVCRHIFASAFSFFWKTNPDLYKKTIGAFIEVGGFEKFNLYLKDKPIDLKEYLFRVVPQDLWGTDSFNIKDYGWTNKLFNESSAKKGLCNIVVDKYLEDISDLKKSKEELIREDKDGVDKITRTIKTIQNQGLIEFLSKNNLIPKYGFPVDTVELLVSDNVRLSRDLFYAISEYAPESEIVANGKLFKSRYVRKLSGYEWPTYKYAICDECLTLNHARDLSSKELTEYKQCGNRLGKKNRYIIPKFGFLPDVEPPKPVGLNKPERTYKGSISYIGDETKIKFSEYEICGKRLLVGNQKMDRLAILNESPFYICDTCGYGKVEEKATDSFIEFPHKNFHRCDCRNRRLNRYSLGHEIYTDVAIIKFIDFNIVKYEEAWTILYSMLEGLSRSMNIDRNELSGCLQAYCNKAHPSSENNFGFVLFDNTPGGAGYVRQLTNEKKLLSMLKSGYSVVCDCDCGGTDADTACYGCLCNYYNQKQHDILKRKYALDFYKQIFPDIQFEKNTLN